MQLKSIQARFHCNWNLAPYQTSYPRWLSSTDQYHRHFRNGDNLVKIQHFKEYKYTERITLEAVFGAIDKAAAEKAVAEAEEHRLVAKREAYDQAEILELEPYVDKAAKLLS